jgi:hypothetical protein
MWASHQSSNQCQVGRGGGGGAGVCLCQQAGIVCVWVGGWEGGGAAAAACFGLKEDAKRDIGLNLRC